MPEVSVIIPIYNAQKTLKRCLECLVKQTFLDFEVICVNDGSKDNSQEILEEFCKIDKRFKIFQQENSGPAKARSLAIEKSCGKYLMFCDSDDFFEIDMIEKMHKTIIKQDVDVVMCDCNLLETDKQYDIPKKYYSYCKLNKKGYLKLCFEDMVQINAMLWNKIFKKEILIKNNIVYPTKYEHDDNEFVLKYLLASKTYFGLNESLYNYSVGNSNSIMGKLHLNENFSHELDFLFSQIELCKYIDNKNSELFLKYSDIFLNKFLYFYSKLSDEKKKEAFLILKQYILENKKITKNILFDKLHKTPHNAYKLKSFYIFKKIIKFKNIIFTR